MQLNRELKSHQDKCLSSMFQNEWTVKISEKFLIGWGSWLK